MVKIGEIMPMENTMEMDLRQLTGILKAEQKLYSNYLEALTEQQKHLIDNDLDGLQAGITEINLIARKIMTLERTRKSVIKRISEKLKLDDNDITLSNLLNRFKGRNFEELKRLRNKILDTHVKATAQKERNELLINQSINVIRQAADNLDGKNSPRVTYENPVRKKGNGRPRGQLYEFGLEYSHR